MVSKIRNKVRIFKSKSVFIFCEFNVPTTCHCFLYLSAQFQSVSRGVNADTPIYRHRFFHCLKQLANCANSRVMFFSLYKVVNYLKTHVSLNITSNVNFD